VRLLAASCLTYYHETVIDAAEWPGQMRVPSFGPQMVCTKCGTIGADIRPNWRRNRGVGRSVACWCLTKMEEGQKKNILDDLRFKPRRNRLSSNGTLDLRSEVERGFWGK
jgi:hypothetical protein